MQLLNRFWFNNKKRKNTFFFFSQKIVEQRICLSFFSMLPSLVHGQTKLIDSLYLLHYCLLFNQRSLLCLPEQFFFSVLTCPNGHDQEVFFLFDHLCSKPVFLLFTDFLDYNNFYFTNYLCKHSNRYKSIISSVYCIMFWTSSNKLHVRSLESIVSNL